MDTDEHERLGHAMIEGYITTREDRDELNRDWQIVDGEHRPTWGRDEPAGAPGDQDGTTSGEQ
jgi:hypothetical protein